MHLWKSKTDDEHIIAGKDLQAGGTWLGINASPMVDAAERISFSALTNYRLGKAQTDTDNFSSRGELVTKALRQKPAQLLAYLSMHANDYQGFNLIYGQLCPESTALYCFDSVKKKETQLHDGFHSICNGALDDIWPKMAAGQNKLKQYVTQEKALNVDYLMSLMQNTTQAPGHLLPNTGVPLDWEQRLSSIFIVSPEYGTRSTCVLLMNNQGDVSIYQQEYNALGQVFNTNHFAVSASTHAFKNTNNQ